jgi:hypothetical protein
LWRDDIGMWPSASKEVYMLLTLIAYLVLLPFHLTGMYAGKADMAIKETTPGLQLTLQDPSVPMISLPTRFSTHRVNVDKEFSGSIDIANLEGPGCIRHIWLLFGKGRRLEIHVDGAKVSQIDLPQDPFFGIMHDRKPCFIDCAAFTVLPNPVFGDQGVPGYNLWLPIPS